MDPLRTCCAVELDLFKTYFSRIECNLRRIECLYLMMCLCMYSRSIFRVMEWNTDVIIPDAGVRIGLLFYLFIVMTHITRHVLNVEVDIDSPQTNDLILMVTQSTRVLLGNIRKFREYKYGPISLCTFRVQHT